MPRVLRKRRDGSHRVAEGWAHGPQIDKGARWDPVELGLVETGVTVALRSPVAGRARYCVWRDQP